MRPLIPLPQEEIIELATTPYGRELLSAKATYEDAAAAVESALAEELNDAVDAYLPAETDVLASLIRPVNLAAQTYGDAVQYVLSSYQSQLAAAQTLLHAAQADLTNYAYQNWRPPPYTQDGRTWVFTLQSLRPFPSQPEAVAYAQQLQRSPHVVSTGSRVQVDFDPVSQTWAVTTWKPVPEETLPPTGRAELSRPIFADWGSVPVSITFPRPPADTTPSVPADTVPSPSPGDTTLPPQPTTPATPTYSCPPPVIQVVCAQHCPPLQPAVSTPSVAPPSSGGLAGMTPIPPAPPEGGMPAPPAEAPPPRPGEELMPPPESTYSPGPGETVGEEEEEEEESGIYVAPQPALTCSLPGLEAGWEIVAVFVGNDRTVVSRQSEEFIRQNERDYPDRAFRYTVVQCSQRFESIVLREIKPERCPITEATRPTVTAMPPPHAAMTSLMLPAGQYSEDIDVGCDGRIVPIGGDLWRAYYAQDYFARRVREFLDSEFGESQ